MNGWERLVIGSLGIDTSYRSARITLDRFPPAWSRSTIDQTGRDDDSASWLLLRIICSTVSAQLVPAKEGSSSLAGEVGLGTACEEAEAWRLEQAAIDTLAD